ncbi:penicillin-binding protein 2A [Scopulibacillus darangshiensis]|uniref:Penicillin-binding protein 2A n=2 Tax=Scopulibacillus darangshiensis TaxID=442528 RepID=A0A4R2P591_9BACL|nr:penicillin-binding protein 2A [Scopulibacillus darangshiensis]
MLKKVLIAVNVILGMLILGLIGYIIIIFAGNYVIDKKDLVMDTTTKIVDTEGHEISKLYLENRELVSIEKIPKSVQEAFIATEDSRFYQHYGIDFRGTFRAAFRDIISGSKSEGGSTITQQLAKRVFLSNEKSWLRKIKEAVIAINLERKYSKQQILEMYLNDVYFGHGAYGIGSAAKFYFNKDVSELTVDEGAMLAAMLKAPSTYSPILHPKKALKRRNLVLSLMEEQGYISSKDAVRLQGKTLGLDLKKHESHPEFYTYVDMVLDEAKRKYHLSNEEVLSGGYKIIVPMDIKAQKASYKHFKDDSYFKGSNPNKTPNGAFVLMDPKTGGVLAVQGGRHYVKKGLNHVTMKRQPGSTFKPLAVYGPALNSGKYKPYSLLTDKKLTYAKYDDYTPENYNHKYAGKITMYDALTHSTNAPAVWLFNKIGIEKGKAYLKKLGFKLPDKGLAIALGGLRKGVTPLSMASAYSVFPNNGEKVEPYFIKAIYNHDGELIGHAKPKATKVFKKQTAWYMTKMLESVVQNGTGKAGEVHTALAGKTGSTGYEKVKDGLRDAWFVGYTPKAVGAVWIGYNTTTEDQYVTSGSGDATRLFKDIINDIPKQQHLTFHKPRGVKDLEPPIRLGSIKNLEASVTLGRYGLPAVRLTWTPLEDDRVIYRIYEMKDGQRQQIGEVTGKGEYVVDFANPLSTGSFVVVPYNVQTKQEGAPSPGAAVDWFPGF